MPAPCLVARTAPLPDPGDLLSLLPPEHLTPAVMSWVREGDGMVAWGRAAHLHTGGADRFADADAWWREVVASAVVRDPVDLPGTGPVAFGSFSFAPGSPAGGTLVVPSVIVGRRDGRSWITTVRRRDELPELASPRRYDAATPPQAVRELPGALTTEQWRAAVADGISRIRGGEVDKIVLARDVLAECAEPVDVRGVLARLASTYPNTWTFHVDGLVGATPELLLRRERGLVTSRVLAGTIRRTGEDEKDLASAARLARSSKDLEEHEYAVRSVAEALAPYCRSTNVPEAPFVLHLPNVMHLASDVTGVLHEQATSLQLAAALHPSAAVCGTPTRQAAQVVADLEQMDRGRYAGPVGWTDSRGDGEWGIALRCGELVAAEGEAARAVRLFAGCGIVAGSDPSAELAESEAKLVPMRSALGAGA